MDGLASGLRIAVLLTVGLYLAALVVLFIYQRSLLYHPYPVRTGPAEAGLEGANEVEIATPDGAKLIAWHLKAKAGQPTLLYFHGNGGSLAGRAARFALFGDQGWGVFAMSYRGYSGSTGYPTEAGNVADAMLAYDRLAAMTADASKIIAMGESLGTGVAVQVAARKPVVGIILDAPYSSMAAVAQYHYPFFPVSTLMRDRYDSAAHIAKVKAPILILHGARDEVIPVRFGQALADAAPEPKTLIIFPEGSHEDLIETGGVEVIAAWLKNTAGDAVPTSPPE